MKRVTVVGMGPGDPAQMTLQAKEILSDSEVIIGYTRYVDLLKEQFPDKVYRTTGMGQEIARCRLAFEAADAGEKTALICSGDAGIYGMASPLYEVGEDYPQVEIRVVPGVTAALSGAALLGAPLGNDFCLISLSDYLTDWTQIEKRLLAAARADFVLCLYNPDSGLRKGVLKKACTLLRQEKADDTVCGLAREIGRAGETLQVLSLAELTDTPVDMSTTVFIGNSQTKVIRGQMVTPRGYRYGES